jgi:hypothetical protein
VGACRVWRVGGRAGGRTGGRGQRRTSVL